MQTDKQMHPSTQLLCCHSELVTRCSFLKTKIFSFFRNMQSTTNRPQVQFHSFSIPGIPLSPQPSIRAMSGTTKRNSFLIQKDQIDKLNNGTDYNLETDVMHRCLISKKVISLCLEGRNGLFSKQCWVDGLSMWQTNIFEHIHKNQTLIDFRSDWGR